MDVECIPTKYDFGWNIDRNINANKTFKEVIEKYDHFETNINGKNIVVVINNRNGFWFWFYKEDIDKKIPISILNKLYRKVVVSPPQNYPSSLILNVTGNCNLRCKYCFAEGISRENMSEKVADKAIEILKYSPYRNVRIEFQGGEPLLNFKLIKYVVKKSESKLKNKIIHFGLETNGTLINDEIIKFFIENDFSVGISIDGPFDADRFRVNINGKNSFEVVDKNLRKLSKVINKEKLGSVAVISRANVNNPIEILKYFNEVGVSFKTVPVNPMGNAKINKEVAIKNHEWYQFLRKMYEYMRDHKKEIRVTNFMLEVMFKNLRSPERNYICLRSPCGMAREIISINPNGDVYPCDGFKGSKEFVMGNILKDKVDDIVFSERYQKLKERTVDKIKKCSKCIFRSLCGPCAYAAYGAFGSIYREDPYCEARRALIGYFITEIIKHQMEGKEVDFGFRLRRRD